MVYCHWMGGELVARGVARGVARDVTLGVSMNEGGTDWWLLRPVPHGVRVSAVCVCVCVCVRGNEIHSCYRTGTATATVWLW